MRGVPPTTAGVYPVRLAGERCVLREVEDGDVDAVYALTAHPGVLERVLDEHPPSREEIRAALTAWRAEARAEPRSSYRLAAVAGGELVGMGTLTVDSAAHRRGEIGYVLHPDHWGAGLGTELSRLLLRLGFERVGLHRIEATTRPDHVASCRVLEKAGRRREGLSRDHLLVRGRWWDSVRYAVLATER
ncbi:GNAT family N-acetyltransferase [Micromonospora olivasterospora]|uniref:RimJ/RimL family protein N-acetyltransferase n=1 Tax=Micromonospora olivasterospora TaxID=1880 RepID=A0A562IF68_MICOL|nr:GNAT family protein [Micromonospora olivasterospora]TWH69466.1 RimJ/RimL family protein N-acetyltransferase [Micromonospora olivasterospora]